MATRFQTYKEVNNGRNGDEVSVAVFSCKRCERRERLVLKFLIQVFGDLTLLQLVKATFRRRILLTSTL